MSDRTVDLAQSEDDASATGCGSERCLCRACLGSGNIDGEACEECGGTGQLDEGIPEA